MRQDLHDYKKHMIHFSREMSKAMYRLKKQLPTDELAKLTDELAKLSADKKKAYDNDKMLAKALKRPATAHQLWLRADARSCRSDQSGKLKAGAWNEVPDEEKAAFKERAKALKDEWLKHCRSQEGKAYLKKKMEEKKKAKEEYNKAHEETKRKRSADQSSGDEKEDMM